MTAKILDGIKLSNITAKRLRKLVKTREARPRLVIIQVGNLPESNRYISRKRSYARKIGVTVSLKKYPTQVRESRIISDIKQFNSDKKTQGIMVQLPLPKHFDTRSIVSTIDPKKDADGLRRSSPFMPATVRGVLTLLKHYKIGLKGRKVVMVGASELIGKPIARMCADHGAMVTICNNKTKNLEKKTQHADILITAVGLPGLIKTRHVHPHQIVIDVGITIHGKKVLGDVDFEPVSRVVKAITPVPGGVGPMTIASLFENLLAKN